MFDPEILKNIALYVPLSIIGLWRWTYWIVRRICAAFYRPNTKPWPKNVPRPTVSIVTPVYNEDHDIFEQAMRSWIRNGVDEIIAVIDKSNVRHIVEFERKYASNKKHLIKFRLIVTPKPGKRAALCDGIEIATGDIIALVDSDTIWSDDVLEKTVPYFQDESIGGATVAQRIQNPHNVANVMFDMLLYSRYKDEVPFLLVTGQTFNTLSGRTAFYRREAIFNPEYDNIHSLRHEFFLGTRGVSGDDKRLTHLIIEQGWHTTFVKGPVVLTPGLNSIKKFMKQRLRWTRNSWRADLRAVGRGWVFAHPALAFFMIDRFLQPFFMLIGPVVFIFAAIHREWLFMGILIMWWLVSRFIRVFGYFKQNPKRVIYLPAYIIYGYANAVIKIYAFATLIENTWATRWHKSRTARRSMLRKTFTVASGGFAVLLFIFIVVQIVNSIGRQAGEDIPVQKPVDLAAYKTQVDSTTKAQQNEPIPSSDVDPTSVETYIVQPGDTLQVLAESFGMNITDLKKLNNIQDSDKISVGQPIIHFKGSIK
jgi:cellulose synthase/poly-beta-1,6-N-acetylglucosamine synthase-like glycosyltransferase